MAELVANCPRCGTKKITFDVLADQLRWVEHGWLRVYESFCICRHCGKPTMFVLKQRNYENRDFFDKAGPSAVKGGLDAWVAENGYVSLKDELGREPPEHLEPAIKAVFEEGAKCAAIKCYNAAGTMFRLCVDLATRPLLPDGEVQGLNAKTKRDLGLRLPWLFDNHKLPEALRDLSHCIKEDGNDGAHKGTLTEADAEDLLDFTFQLLDRMFSEAKRLELAKARREARRNPPKAAS